MLNAKQWQALHAPAPAREDRAADGLLGQCFELPRDGRVMEVTSLDARHVRVRLDGGHVQAVERATFFAVLARGGLAVATRRPTQ